jgi:hypothetical protein
MGECDELSTWKQCCVCSLFGTDLEPYVNLERLTNAVCGVSAEGKRMISQASSYSFKLQYVL